uniref:Very long-chain fatty acid transport protein n=1 Tax=Plectus sambesii TaxID=2011161 RepID=A0A914WR34_9BILA
MDVRKHRPLIELLSLALGLLVTGPNYRFVAFFLFLIYKLISYLWGDFLFRALQTFPRDFKGLFLLSQVKKEIARRMKEDRGLHEIFLDVVKRHPRKTALVDIERDKSWTFQELNELANQFANYFHKQGFKEGDVVALYMGNCPEFVAAWIGMAKIGVITAWINYNLRLDALKHSITVANAKGVIAAPDLQSAVKEALSTPIPVFVYGDVASGSSGTDLLKALSSMPTTEPPRASSVNFKSVLCYIYTSGTTGLPKAAVMKHFRYYWISMGGRRAFGLDSSDRIYVTMPLYHTAAGILGVGQTVTHGVTCVIRKKFSATNFWKDCVKYECTASQYIGEICRYLLAQPVVPEEELHKVRVMYGNGLRPELWPEFVERFRIQRVGEVYGSTEGNSNIVNTDNHVGACGFFPIYPFLTWLYPLRLVKVDEQTGEIIRENGLCVPCKPGETGEMVGAIRRKDPLMDFVGYVSQGDTDKKVLKDVFKKGDEVFTSGDVLMWDRQGYLYFKDRRGDTFRWKGENCSTTEVEKVLQPVKSVQDATVFGVEIPGMEGRAGMAAIALNTDANVEEEKFLANIGEILDANLPAYARPVFIRLCQKVELTGTFKLVKTNLQKDGFNLAKCGGDKVYYWDSATKKYLCLDRNLFDQIEKGQYNRF